METWYRTGGYSPRALIEPVQVARSTDKTVVTIGEGFDKAEERRHPLRSDWYCYWRTWDEGRRYLIDEAQKALDNARARLRSAETGLERALAIPYISPQGTP